jgi:hypothetical protein
MCELLLYRAYLKGDPLQKGSNRNELCLCKLSESRDLLLSIAIVAKYAPSFFYASRMSHMEGEKVFKSCKQGTNLPPSSKGDSHIHDHVNFFRPWMDTTSIGITTSVFGGGPMPIVGTHCAILVVTHNGGKVYQSNCGHGVWHIECCPPRSNS